MINALSNSYLLEYINKCESGEIIIGQETKQCLERYKKLFNDPDIMIDFTEAHKRIKFIETHCKHFEAPFAGQPFKLELFQKAIIESIYIFYIYDDEVGRHIRLHQDVLLFMSRKNGKTPFASAIGLAEFFCGEMGTKILCSSNDYEQAALMFDAINSMREESPSLVKYTRKNVKGIFFGNPKTRITKGKFSYQNKGSIKKISAKTGAKEGRNLRVGLVDEVHELKDDSSTMPIRQALSTQDEPLYFELTTEGFVNEGYLDKRLADARKVLRGELDRPRWCIWLFTQDNEREIWEDEKSWYKSNPGLGVIKKWSFLRQMVEEAKTNKSTRVFVLAKDFNLKQNNAAAWLSREIIINEETFDIEKFRNAFAIGAVDLSKTGDLACARAMFLRNGKKYMLQQYFIPQSKLESLTGEEKRRYEEWIKEGYITVSDGNENDFSLVTAWFIKLVKEYGIRFYKIGYDKWSAIYWVKEMEDYGFDMVRVAQEWSSMSEPMKLVEKDLTSKLINYNNNPIDRYCLQNTAIVMNSKSEIMPVKVQGKDEMKIDGAVTMIIAYRVYINNRNEFLELSKRGE